MGEFLLLTRNSLRRQFGRPRILVAALLTICCALLAYFEVPKYLVEHHKTLQALEPFIFLFSKGFPDIPVLLVFLVLAGDMPFFHEGMETTLTRTTRRKWLNGQISVVWILTLLWLLFFLLCSLCVFGKDLLSLDNRWSSFGKVLARAGRGVKVVKVGFGLGAQPSMDLIQGRTPLGALGLTLLLNAMQFTCIGMWCMGLNLWTKRSYGSIVLVVFWILRRFGDGYGAVGKTLNYLNPIGLTALGSWDIRPEVAWRIGLIYVFEVAALWVLSMRRIRRMDMTKLG